MENLYETKSSDWWRFEPNPGERGWNIAKELFDGICESGYNKKSAANVGAKVSVLAGESAAPCTRNPLQRG